jgi:excisionase family DNA binding protein
MRQGVLAVRGDPGQPRSFLSVAEVAELLGMSPMTVYRAIQCGEFPAVRIRGRLIVPARAIEQMVDAALVHGGGVDAADWVPDPDTPATPPVHGRGAGR